LFDARVSPVRHRRKEVEMRTLAKFLMGLMLALALSISATTPAVAADEGPPVGGGGCNMVDRGGTGTTAGLDPMMTGAQHGNGQTNMLFVMLSKFGGFGACDGTR
jgi:hypothetical protein